jgi:hypothetical protein
MSVDAEMTQAEIDALVMTSRRGMLVATIAGLDPDGRQPRKQLRRVARLANVLGLNELRDMCQAKHPRKALRAIRRGFRA